MKVALSTILISVAFAQAVSAGEVSHYAGGGPNVRDFMMPKDSGLYLSSYNFYYQSGRLNDGNGREIPLPGTSNPALFPDVDVYMMAIPIALVQKQVFGPEHENTDYAFMITPTFGNTSLSASESIDDLNSQPVDSQFGLGDLYVQPLWLGFAPTGTFKDLFQFSLQWGFYAPTGKYDTDPSSTSPTGRSSDPDNIGAGFWTNLFRGAFSISPWKGFGPAVVVAGTYEVNSEKDRLHVTPGDQFTLNWGYTQYLPSKIGNFALGDWAFEFGPAGYDSWQVSSDSGSGRGNNTHKDDVHAVGFQIGIVENCMSSVTFHYFYELESEDRFQGHVIGLSLTTFFASKHPFTFQGYSKPDCSCIFDEPSPPPTPNG